MSFSKIKGKVSACLVRPNFGNVNSSLPGLNKYTKSATKMASTNDLHLERLFSVKDYVCVITGGGSGIGLMAAQGLSANGSWCVKLLRKRLTTWKVQKYT